VAGHGWTTDDITATAVCTGLQAGPRGRETPVDIDARVEADNILGDLHLRALGD